MTTAEILSASKKAAEGAWRLTTEQKNRALMAIASALRENASLLLEANSSDVDAARGTVSEVMLDRLSLNPERIEAMAFGIERVAELDDPCGKILSEQSLENGLVIKKLSVPFGTVAVIYESRPNVTSDAAALCLKSGNACILRGGKEAYRTSKVITEVMRRAVAEVGCDPELICIIDDTSRKSAEELMRAQGYVDLLIPRGGAGLINACLNNATVPCLQTGTGICHIYVDSDADMNKALKIIENAKTSRPSVCNAAEVCLVHEAAAEAFLPSLKTLLVDGRIKDGKQPVELILDDKSAKIISGTPAGAQSFDTEFLDYKLAVGIVSSVEEAVTHILKHSTRHSEAIITENGITADYFCRATDSAAVYVNASTRFTDGGEFGLGCEIGISTQKMHARGPVGLAELNTYKYIVTGNGNIR